MDPGSTEAVGIGLGHGMPGWHGEAVLEKADGTHGTVAERPSFGNQRLSAAETPPVRKARLGPKGMDPRQPAPKVATDPQGSVSGKAAGLEPVRLLTCPQS